MKNKLAIAFATILSSVACGDIDDHPYKACAFSGGEGCACRVRGICDRLPDGTKLVCLDDVCQIPQCAKSGSLGEGCLCAASGVCGAGFVCTNGLCAEDSGQSLVPPLEPRCYTPCRGGGTIEVNGQAQFIECGADGLIPGCIGNAVCRSGSCVVAVTELSAGALSSALETLPDGVACDSDTACSFFQSCIQGVCYSDCVRDNDCREGRECHLRACRKPCVAEQDECPSGTYCATENGTTGHCLALPTSPPDQVAETSVAGHFTLEPTFISLKSNEVTGFFEIHNTTSFSQQFLIRKLRHKEFSDSGADVITEAPLFWLEFGESEDATERLDELLVVVEPSATKQVWIGGAENPELARWEGVLEVANAELGSQEVSLVYTRNPDGRWAGKMYFLSNFPVGGLDAWVANRDDRDALRGVGNAFIRRWGAFRDQRISLAEMNAALSAMQNESWKWDSVKQRCPNEAAPNSNVGCYLYDNNEGISIFSDFLPDNPIPTGVLELPIAINLKNRSAADPTRWTGKFVSDESLHYAGDPEIELDFDVDPNTCSQQSGESCVTFLDKFSASVLVGGRYLTESTDTECGYAAPGTFELARVPWLLPGFEKYTARDSVSGRRYLYECRDRTLPFGDEPDQEALNLSMAAANPVPDGATRRRGIELIDGALINQDSMFIIFRERFPSFLSADDPKGFDAYGYIVLQRIPTNVEDDEYVGSKPVDYRPAPDLPGIGCEDWILQTVLPAAPYRLDETTVNTVGEAVVTGIVPTAVETPTIGAAHPEKVHYFCADTGYFDGGPNDEGGPESFSVECPLGSEVTFFTLQGPGASQAAVALNACQTGGGVCNIGEPCADVCEVGATCQSKGFCGQTLNGWRVSGTHQVRVDPVWQCIDENEVFCDYDRLDLRNGKKFYGSEASEAVFRSLDDEINDAYRYKTRFKNRTGTSVGFAPAACVSGSSVIPYCYDAEAIERILERVDCATAVYANHYDELEASTRATMKSFLVRNYAYGQQEIPGNAVPLVIDGNERLFAELLIMLGDDSYTSAFASRFDLAGQQLADFEGAAFEPSGINLSGGAGYEMYSLYQAAQYYQRVLDRFYRLAPTFWSSIATLPPDQGFITQRTATSYLDRLIRASSQKSRVWSAISQRYQSFNRPDLARLVVGRAYTSAYLESVILSRMMTRLIDVADQTEAAQLVKQLELAQRTYSVGMLEMRSVYADISDSVTFYGIPPDYIPFPALGSSDDNAFNKAFGLADRAVEVAAEKEERALTDNREFETDSALFQAELARIRDESETQLADICGTFTVTDGASTTVYPAIPKYAYLSEVGRLVGDPCGRVGNGGLYNAVGEIEIAQVEFESVKLSARHLLAEQADLEARVDAQCGRIQVLANYKFVRGQFQVGLRGLANGMQAIVDTTENAMDIAGNLANLAKCDVLGSECATAGISAGAYTAFGVIATVGVGLLRAGIVAAEIAVDEIGTHVVRAEDLSECEALEIDEIYQGLEIARRMKEVELEALRLHYRLQLTFANVLKLRNESLRIMADQAENEQLAINIEAARNDPNVRIYRNDAIFSADRTFYEALTAAYRATKVFEYYTSQSYADLERLYLVRMVSHGDFTLESYLSDLAHAYTAFEEQFGNPDTRLLIVSLKDDVLQIPKLSTDSVALSEDERTKMFRDQLQDSSLIDSRGYISMGFATALSRLSPLTVNHKILYMEAEVIGDDVGDTLGRVYVAQRGTGVVRSVDDEQLFYALPERTAVIDAFFNGERPLDPLLYATDRLRDRPVVNTGWEFILNKKDESVNEDINLGSLSDVRLFVYYTDFTNF